MVGTVLAVYGRFEVDGDGVCTRRALCLLVVTDFKDVYFYCNWLGCVWFLEFELRMRHRPRMEVDSFFAGSHNMELFCVQGRKRISLYRLVFTWWT